MIYSNTHTHITTLHWSHATTLVSSEAIANLIAINQWIIMASGEKIVFETEKGDNITV